MLKNVVKKLSAVLAVSAMALVAFPASFKAFPPTVKDLKDYNWAVECLNVFIKENAALAANLDRDRFTHNEYREASYQCRNADLSKLPYVELVNKVPMTRLAIYIASNGLPDGVSAEDFRFIPTKLIECLLNAVRCRSIIETNFCFRCRYKAAGAEYNRKTGFFKIPEEMKEEEEAVSAVSAMASVTFPAAFKAFPPTVEDLKEYNWNVECLHGFIKENAALATNLDRERFTDNEYRQACDKYRNAVLFKLTDVELVNKVPVSILVDCLAKNGVPEETSTDDFLHFPKEFTDCLINAVWYHSKIQEYFCIRYRYEAAGAKFEEETGFFRIPEEKNEEEEKVDTKLSLRMSENFVFEKS